MHSFETHAPAPRRRSGIVLPLVLAAGAFAIGVGGTVGYISWQAQQARIADMAEQLRQIQTGNTVTRGEGIDLLATSAETTQAARPAPQAAQITEEVKPATAPAAAPQSTAARIKALTSKSSDPMVSAVLAREEARRETMSVAIQGVNELAQAAMSGNYILSTEQQNGRAVLRIWFPQNMADQQELEQLLSTAAGAGMIAVKDSVKTSNGSYDGAVILFDLVERVLNNGTAEERKLGVRLRQEAQAMLDTIAPEEAQEVEVVGAERFYTVEPGDSLAFIALQFYGNTASYLKIFEANRNILSSPERIQIGQRLVIPQA